MSPYDEITALYVFQRRIPRNPRIPLIRRRPKQDAGDPESARIIVFIKVHTAMYVQRPSIQNHTEAQRSKIPPHWSVQRILKAESFLHNIGGQVGLETTRVSACKKSLIYIKAPVWNPVPPPQILKEIGVSKLATPSSYNNTASHS